jgi:hypothetical protein
VKVRLAARLVFEKSSSIACRLELIAGMMKPPKMGLFEILDG